MERFSTKLEHRWIMLNGLVDAVKFSFIVRNSISYLNLHLSEYSDLHDRSRTVLEVANDFVCTEEKCRRIFAPSRSLLYNLNLDMPARREYRLKNDLAACRFSRDSSIPHIAKITLSCGFDFWNMCHSIEDAFKVTDQKLKILGFLVKSPHLKGEILRPLPAHIMNNFIDYFYPKITDSVLFKDFIETLDLEEWMTTYEEPAILEHLLYHVRHHGRNLNEEGYSMCQLMDKCILSLFFSNIVPILKYTDAPGFSSEAYDMYVSEISDFIPNLTEEVLAGIERRLTPQRLYLMLQILSMYIESNRLRCTETISEALRLLWNSSPVACITFGEIETAFKGFLPDKELKDMYEFYCSSIDEHHSVVESRPLKHLCRTTIRRILKKHFWIPEGVRLTGLPLSLQSFLNLEKFIITT
ncbi:hypothetical protein AVEN_218616-1 [Araneus ventricosus]|uniref:SOCS box domain-containing protein n=1 Tax=Araneus ventricosus TaxID=182803 RepID=A0A4Y2WCR8_ARAVE|nr:hypothetical protein AVEN_218616-1 [Araneus ventricosus]